jgi:hypothetical protein
MLLLGLELWTFAEVSHHFILDNDSQRPFESVRYYAVFGYRIEMGRFASVM